MAFLHLKKLNEIMYMIVNLTFLPAVWQERFAFFSSAKIRRRNGLEPLTNIAY